MHLPRAIIPKKSMIILNMSTISLGLGAILFSGVQQKLLALCFGNADRSFYTNELIRLAGCGNGPVQRELKRMSAAGLLVSKTVGNQRHYQANRDCPIYPEMASLIRKTFGVSDIVRQAILPVAAQIEVALIYGSIARGEERAGSDIDLLVISDTLTYADLYTLLETAAQTLARPVNPTVYSRAEWTQRISSGNSFVTRVLAQPMLPLIGSEHDARQPAAHGQSEG
ncbi:nucleotidyltransferase domain-containing protein [Amantichitinum ursilacus]|uniref:Polymerase beta nucleotidyltransferase domain-containing protein n=1 Tax=Amantichitinum ursilacus TaxID=857265 RepID=A0A0N0GQS4_9NEIS|nr:nucleotidyltransferase domain-containing protein [Amantichitinum ursilacus]KPC54721.1 hypothetical protein WG78_04085 [Amantichitinum ursilacus]